MIDLREALSNLEARLHNELYNLKLMIQSLIPNSFHQQPRNEQQQNYYNPHQGFSVPNFHQQPQVHRQIPPPAYHENNVGRIPYYETSTKRSTVPPENVTSPSKAATTETVFTKQPEVINVIRNKLKSLESGKRRSEITTQEPITTTTTNPSPTIPLKNEYTYYWKLESFPKVFKHAKTNEVFSHVFNVKGLFLRIRANLQQLESEDFELDLEHLANVENTNQMEIEISDGLVFKEIAEEELFQYSFAIMDQNRPNHDLISPVFWNTDNDNFLVPNSLHLLANYVKNESLLIKLIILF
jgi:hypothetical protein